VGQCTFCYHHFRTSPYQRRSDQVFLDEIAWLQANNGLHSGVLWDDLAFHSRIWAERFARAILEWGFNLHLIGHCRAVAKQREGSGPREIDAQGRC